jgi:hypothetical protein
MRRAAFPNGNPRFEVYIRVKNIGDGFLTECTASLVEMTPRPDNDLYTFLSTLGDLSKGASKYLLIAWTWDRQSSALQDDRVYFAFQQGGLSGGFASLKPPRRRSPSSYNCGNQSTRMPA